MLMRSAHINRSPNMWPVGADLRSGLWLTSSISRSKLVCRLTLWPEDPLNTSLLSALLCYFNMGYFDWKTQYLALCTIG
jgi:hypothetical protein